jgi:hypothetical protein
MAAEDSKRRGVRRTVRDPAGRAYIVQAAPTGYVEWPTYGRQGVIGLVVNSGGGYLVNRLIYGGGWSMVIWQGDDTAPKRNKVVKRRYRTPAEATAAVDEAADLIARGERPI